MLAAMTRAMSVDHDPGTGETESAMLMRTYRDAMMRTHQRVPTLGEVLAAAHEAAFEVDDGKRRQILGAIQRTGTETLGGGTSYGFAIAPAFSAAIFDRAREIEGPWSMCRWIAVKTLEFKLPTSNEASLANGQRFGGLTSRWATSEAIFPPPSDAKLALIEFRAARLPVLTVVSRDLMADQDLLGQWLNYAATAEIRYNIENAMINGALGGPQGVIGAPSTIVVAKDSNQSSGTITASNIDGLWGAIAPANTMSPGFCWHANKATIAAIDKLAAGGQYPEAFYQRPGVSPWTPHATLKGKPLIPSAFCPDLGTPGDLIAVDWRDYAMAFVRPKLESSVLTVEFPRFNDDAHLGDVGLPSDSVWARRSDVPYFANDLTAMAWVFRGTGGFLWTGPSQDAQGNAIGPAAVIEQR